MLGSCRDLHAWTALSGTRFVAAGTNLKLYIVDGNLPLDITPIRATTSAGGRYLRGYQWFFDNYCVGHKQRRIFK